MLLLTRRIHEEIVVIDKETGEQIIVAPTGLHGNQIRIGIEASKTRFAILRREVLERQEATELV